MLINPCLQQICDTAIRVEIVRWQDMALHDIVHEVEVIERGLYSVTFTLSGRHFLLTGRDHECVCDAEWSECRLTVPLEFWCKSPTRSGRWNWAAAPTNQPSSSSTCEIHSPGLRCTADSLLQLVDTDVSISWGGACAGGVRPAHLSKKSKPNFYSALSRKRIGISIPFRRSQTSKIVHRQWGKSNDTVVLYAPL